MQLEHVPARLGHGRHPRDDGQVVDHERHLGFLREGKRKRSLAQFMEVQNGPVFYFTRNKRFLAVSKG